MIMLPIKKKWFDMVDSGVKKEEYRSITKRYRTMFTNAADDQGRFWCILQNGYAKDSPRLYIYVQTSIGTGNTEWGAEEGEQYFVLSIIEKRKSLS